MDNPRNLLSLQSQRSQSISAPAKALQRAIAQEQSGRMMVTDPTDPSICWCVYFSQGQIHFAESIMGQQERLSYLLPSLYPKIKPALTQPLTSTYHCLIHLWQSQNLTLEQLRELLDDFTQEALVQILAIPQAQLHFETHIGLDPLLFAAPLDHLIYPLREVISQWALMRSGISSPFQRPFIKNHDQMVEYLCYLKEHCQIFLQLSVVGGQNRSLYQIAHQCRLDVKDLAVVLHPLIKADVIGMNPYLSYNLPRPPMIACIDPNKPMQHLVKVALAASGYDVMQLLDPRLALARLQQQLPALILINTKMRQMDGYELCHQLRQQASLSNIPIVMLTQSEGILDRLRNFRSGAVAFLTKPFHPQELLCLVQELAPLKPFRLT